MEFIKIDDPRLDENFSFMFLFKRGDRVRTKDDARLRGEITDAAFVGELPASITGANDSYKKGRTLYEIKVADKDRFIVADSEIEKEE
jgi:hypothetical protein